MSDSGRAAAVPGGCGVLCQLRLGARRCVVAGRGITQRDHCEAAVPHVRGPCERSWLVAVEFVRSGVQAVKPRAHSIHGCGVAAVRHVAAETVYNDGERLD